MTRNYKLKKDIQEFIIEQKRSNQKLSCRGMAALIKERFRTDISKSLINNVFKQSNLSSPVGRRRLKETIKLKIAPEIQIIRQEAESLENSGFFFLKAADLKLGLTSKLAEVLSGYFSDLSQENHQAIIETLIYWPFFKDKRSIWVFMGKEISEESLTQYPRQLLQVPLLQLKESVAKTGINHNTNEINELWKECLLRLNSYIVHYFPPEYQFLDFSAMQERFYCLPGKLERKSGLLVIQLFYPKGFFGVNDIIWQEGFSYAANRVNEAKILTPVKDQIWINPQVHFP